MPLPSAHLREMKTYVPEKACTRMFVAALFLRGKQWKQPEYPSVDEWINKVQCSHTRGCYLAIKRNIIAIYATIWMSCENIMLNERSRPQRTTYCMVPFVWNAQNGQVQRQNRLVAGWARGRGMTAARCRVSLWSDENWSWWVTVSALKGTESYTLNGWTVQHLNYTSINLFLKRLPTFAPAREGLWRGGIWVSFVTGSELSESNRWRFTEHLRARHCVKHFTIITSFNPHTRLMVRYRQPHLRDDETGAQRG